MKGFSQQRNNLRKHYLFFLLVIVVLSSFSDSKYPKKIDVYAIEWDSKPIYATVEEHILTERNFLFTIKKSQRIADIFNWINNKKQSNDTLPVRNLYNVRFSITMKIQGNYTNVSVSKDCIMKVDNRYYNLDNSFLKFFKQDLKRKKFTKYFPPENVCE